MPLAPSRSDSFLRRYLLLRLIGTAAASKSQRCRKQEAAMQQARVRTATSKRQGCRKQDAASTGQRCRGCRQTRQARGSNEAICMQEGAATGTCFSTSRRGEHAMQDASMKPKAAALEQFHLKSAMQLRIRGRPDPGLLKRRKGNRICHSCQDCAPISRRQT